MAPRSVLDDIPGIGKTRKAALLREHFKKSVDAIKSVDVSSLKDVEGMNLRAAEAVWHYFHKNEQ